MATSPRQTKGNETVSSQTSKPKGWVVDTLFHEISRIEFAKKTRIALGVILLGMCAPLCDLVQEANIRMELDARNNKDFVESLLLANPTSSVLDENTGNALCGDAATRRLDEGLRKGESCNLEFISKKTVKKGIGLANQAMTAYFERNKDEIDPKLWDQYQCIRILDSTRTNQEQNGKRWDWDKWSIKFNWLVIPVGVKHLAAEECFSFHENGQAIDVDNWKVAKPFLEAQGFIQHPKEPWHFSIGEFVKDPKPIAWPNADKGFRKLLVENPTLINQFINDPDALFRYLPSSTEDKREASKKLIGFIKENKGEIWAQEGIRKLKRNVDKGTFRVPPGSFGGIKRFYEIYFPNMPATKMIGLGAIVMKY